VVAVSIGSSLFAWGNVPFVVALGVAVGFGLLQMSGVLGALAGDADADADADGDVDVHAHVNVEADAHADVDGDGDADTDGDGDADAGHVSPLHLVLGALGVGKAPLFVLGETFGVIFGVVGLALGVPYASSGGPPSGALVWTLPVSLAAAGVATRALASLLGRLLAGAGEASSRADLVGLAGVVISTRVDADFGEVRLKDRSGNVVRVICRAEAGEIAEGSEVVVVEEDDRDRRLVVAPLP
jgi:hypothetical protein